MNSRALFLLVTLALFAYASARLACGLDPLQENLSEILIKNDCKGRLNKVDKCCVAHTNCYKAKKNKDACDKQFCDCAHRAAQKLPLCKLQMDNFCVAAKFLGVFKYKG
ncbi:unnamed protein product [Caenorhabditis bovis]|uniref:Domain of unknown function DB domain-containing protein n=1 Tax=Caenorhabditis bovis TaxID=2654633 RepID=A0A8S1E5Y6_9PELO|nr:unnamed protein product [Caenorhabditis bovis]